MAAVMMALIFVFTAVFVSIEVILLSVDCVRVCPMIVLVLLTELSDLISKITGAGTGAASSDDDDDSIDEDDDSIDDEDDDSIDEDDDDDSIDEDDDNIDGLAVVILFLLGLMSMVYGQRNRLSI